MQLKKNVIANAGVTIVLVITTAMAATRPIMAGDASIHLIISPHLWIVLTYYKWILLTTRDNGFVGSR